MRDIVLILHDIRSCHNVGSMLRTAEGIGVTKVYFTGYTPYPSLANDARLPHIHRKLTTQIHKTALGAELLQAWEHTQSVEQLITDLRKDGYEIVGLEQANGAVELPNYKVPKKVAILLGREVEGIEPALLKTLDKVIVIPMFGQKESFNVVQAAAMALYHMHFH